MATVAERGAAVVVKASDRKLTVTLKDLQSVAMKHR